MHGKLLELPAQFVTTVDPDIFGEDQLPLFPESEDLASNNKAFYMRGAREFMEYLINLTDPDDQQAIDDLIIDGVRRGDPQRCKDTIIALVSAVYEGAAMHESDKHDAVKERDEALERCKCKDMEFRALVVDLKKLITDHKL